jgi:hypothetical protein
MKFRYGRGRCFSHRFDLTTSPPVAGIFHNYSLDRIQLGRHCIRIQPDIWNGWWRIFETELNRDSGIGGKSSSVSQWWGVGIESEQEVEMSQGWRWRWCRSWRRTWDGAGAERLGRGWRRTVWDSAGAGADAGITAAATCCCSFSLIAFSCKFKVDQLTSP